LINYRSASGQLEQAERKLEQDAELVAGRTLEQARTAREQAIAAHELPPLREKEARQSAAHTAARIQARASTDPPEEVAPFEARLHALPVGVLAPRELHIEPLQPFVELPDGLVLVTPR